MSTHTVVKGIGSLHVGPALHAELCPPVRLSPFCHIGQLFLLNLGVTGSLLLGAASLCRAQELRHGRGGYADVEGMCSARLLSSSPSPVTGPGSDPLDHHYDGLRLSKLCGTIAELLHLRASGACTATASCEWLV